MPFVSSGYLAMNQQVLMMVIHVVFALDGGAWMHTRSLASSSASHCR